MKSDAQIRLCIFCGTGKQTGEHIHSQWLHEHLERFIAGHRVEVTSRVVYAKGGLGFVREEKERLNEKTVSLKTPGPCARCNNGWMNDDLEKPVRSILLPLVQGAGTGLSTIEVRKLVEWLTVKLFCMDYHCGSPMFTKSERKAFYDHRTIPSSLRGVWAVPLADRASWGAAWERYGGNETASFIFGVGRVLFFAFGDRAGRLRVNEEQMASGRAQRLWPLQSLDSWAAIDALSDAEAEEMAQALDAARLKYNIKIGGKKPLKRLLVAKKPAEQAIRLVLQKETRIFGSDYEDQICGNCDTTLLTDMSVVSFRDSFRPSPFPTYLICPVCGAHNVIPTKQIKKKPDR